MTVASNDGSPGRLPTFLIIGAPKAGTTALAELLAAHPDVFIAPEKEVHYFDTGFRNGLDWYRRRFAGAAGERAVGEASPTYMYRDATLERMRSAVPDAKLIAVLRDPVERAYSHYWWEYAVTETRTFEEAARAEMAGEVGGRRGKYLEGGRYLPRLQRVTEMFSRPALLVIISEELRSDPARVYAEACRHLGIDDSFTPPNLGAAVNPSYRVRWPMLRRAMFRWHAWKRLPGTWANAIDRFNRVEAAYPPLDDGLRRELRAWFTEDNRALAAWLGRDLSIWGAR